MKTHRTGEHLFRTSCTLLILALLAGVALQSRAGVALRLGYDGITGSDVSDLTTNPAFPNAPNTYDVLTTGLVIPMNVANDYGSWIRGFIEAPQTGQHTFWIAAVDSGQLWLSTSEDPAGKTLIAQNGFMFGQGPNDWFLTPGQQSAPVSLVRGQKYYFEILHKEDAAGTVDSVSVAWVLPDGTFQGPLPATAVWPFPVDLANPAYPPLAKAPQVLTSYQGVSVDFLSSPTFVQEGGSAKLTVTVEASQPAYVQWYRDGVAIPGADLLTYHIPTVTLAQDGAVYSVIVTNSLGQDTASTTLLILADSTPPTLVDALSLANVADDVAVVFSKPVDPATATVAANYGLTPSVAITGVRMGASPDTVLLQTAGLATGTAYTLAVNNVRDHSSPPNTIAANSSVPVELDLGAWYRLDESTGTIAVDSSGHGLNGTLVSDAFPGYAGKVLKSVKFEGVAGGYVTLPAGFPDFSTNGLTMSLWVYPTSEGGSANWARFMDFANGAGNDNILFTRTGGDNQVTFEVYNGNTTGGKVTSPLGSLILNQWQHWAATMDVGGNVVIYRNGLPIATGMTAVPNVVTRNRCYLGLSNWATDGHFAGQMDDVRIYDRVLAPSAVAALANGGGADDTDASLPVISAVATVATTALKNTPPGVFTLTRSGATTAPLTVQYVLSGTATNGVTYNSLPGSVVIPAGTNSVPVLVVPKDYSFQGPQQTVILTVAGASEYAIAVADSGTVTIQNNDVGPVALEATADNATDGGAGTVDVWFAAAVANPSATTLANYTLIGAPGLSVTSATLGNRNLRVVLGVSGTVPAGAQLSVTGVRDPGGNTVPAQVPIRESLTPVNLVANIYHSPNTRAECFTMATDGIVNNTSGGAGFDTWNGGGQPSEFVGLIYDYNQDFEVIKVDLGNQFGDGGSWATQPKVYLLKNPLDSNQTRPETDTINWVEVPATLISGSQFKATMDSSPSPETPIVFDLSALSAAQRNGYGWAVGGVKGSGTADFISITEVRAYGTAGTNLAFAFVGQPTNATVAAGQRAKFALSVSSTLPLTLQWQRSGSPISGATTTAYATAPTLLSDSGATFDVQVGVGSIAIQFSQPATLTVLARTNPPVMAATYDPSNLVIEVWFNGSTEPGSSQNTMNYTLNDPSVMISYAAQEGQGCGVMLGLSGALTVAAPTVRVADVLDLDGNTLATQTIPVLPLIAPATRVMANQYQQGRAAAFSRSTDGIVQNDANVTTWTTFGGLANLSDFVGLGYAEPQVFNTVKVDLGYQFGDGGDWALPPRVFIQKLPVDSNQTQPETGIAGWVEVTATLVSGNIFDYLPDAPTGTIPLPNSPIVFDLSQLPLEQRVGYGWAVGGVQGNGSAAQFVSLAELRAFGQSAASLTDVTGAPQVVLNPAPAFQTLPATFPLTFETVVAGSQPVHCQWQHNGLNLADDVRITGAQSPILRIANTLPSDAGQYQLVVTNTAGSNVSTIATLALGPIALDNGGGWIVNGPVADQPIVGDVLMLTQGGFSESRSAFLNYPLSIASFGATFTYQDVGGGGADGAVFVLQNDGRGPGALGGAGGGLGYNGITNSAGLEFNIYNTGGISLRTNGATGSYATTLPVDVRSGHPIRVDLNYDGTTLAATLTDTVTRSVFATNWTVNLPGAVGGGHAYVGFTGASGGVASKQLISDFSFGTVFPPLAIGSASATTVVVSWPVAGGAFVLQQTAELPGDWSDVPDAVSMVGDSYQVTLTLQPGGRFYRLRLP